MTIVVNMFGAPGCGKSTTAAGLFYKLKLLGYEPELVREYVKRWAYKDIKVGKYDQPYLFGKQSNYETELYHKCPVVVTDSPMIMASFYNWHYNQDDSLLAPSRSLMEKAEENGVTYMNFYLYRTFDYVQNSRYETEEEAKKVDVGMYHYFDERNIAFTQRIKGVAEDRVDEILAHVVKKLQELKGPRQQAIEANP